MKKCLIPIVFLLISSCAKDDDSIPALQLSYSTAEFVTDLRAEGASGIPTINWHGNPGTFSFVNTPTSVNIDPDTGEITWNRDLPIGANEIRVLAKNDTQEVSATLTVTSQLGQSLWVGGQNNNAESDVVFTTRTIRLFPDGTLSIQVIDEPDSEGLGIWTLEGSQISLEYCSFCSDINPFDVPNIDEHTLLQGTIINSFGTAYFEGLRYVIRFDPDSEMLRGYFRYRLE